MTKDEALRLAIESLCCVRDMVGHPDNLEYIDHQIAKIEAALEAKNEPMEFFDWYDNAHWGNEDFKEGCHRAWNAAIKYTAKPNQEAKDEPVSQPKVRTGNCLRVGVCASEGHKIQPQRTFVGLTDEEINSVRYKRDWTSSWTDTTFARAIEAKLRSKNYD
jgi:hypothetical protein